LRRPISSLVLPSGDGPFFASCQGWRTRACHIDKKAIMWYQTRTTRPIPYDMQEAVPDPQVRLGGTSILNVRLDVLLFFACINRRRGECL
jgi:hypothetical protein